jgi:hypothetical protein
VGGWVGEEEIERECGGWERERKRLRGPWGRENLDRGEMPACVVAGARRARGGTWWARRAAWWRTMI